MTVQLHVGYIGKTRAGERVEIVGAREGDSQWKWVDQYDEWYTVSGKLFEYEEEAGDIIGPWEEPAAKVGEWIGWNGGECPVHPDTVVEVVGGWEPAWQNKAHHKFVVWRNVIAYRIIKEHKEPREVHMKEMTRYTMRTDNPVRKSDFWEECSACDSGAVLFREVLDDE